MTEGLWLDAHQERAWRALQFMQMRLEGELARQLAHESGLSYPDYVVLVALTDAPQGQLRLHELGAVLGWEASRLSHHVSRMVGRRLVSKRRCGDDRRGFFVVVSARGRAMLAEAAPGHVATVRRLFIDRLSANQLEVVAAAAEAVLEGLNSAYPEVTTPQRMSP